MNTQSRKRKIAVALVAFLLVGVGIASLTAGGVFAVLNQTNVDNEGYSLSNAYPIRTSTYMFMLALYPYNDPSATALTKWVVTSVNSGKTIFVGWAPENEVSNYLNGVELEAPYPGWDWDYGPYESTLNVPATKIWGENPPVTLPTQETFWANSAQTNDVAEIHYNKSWDNNTLGNMILIVMNADGSAGVQANLQMGLKIPILGILPMVLIPVGLVLIISGLALFLMRRRFYTPSQTGQ